MRRFVLIGGVLCLVAIAGACSSTGSATPSDSSPPKQSDATVTDRPSGPVADVSQELTGSKDPFMGEAVKSGAEAGYVEHEYAAAGTATSYTSATPLAEDGRWALEPGATAPYRTRVLVRRPADPAAFSGTVVVEWLNVSGGIDANPEYTSLHEELTRQGDIWVGVSAQLIGVEGGPVLVPVAVPGAEGIVGKGLKTIDPERYSSLQHPGDGFSFDIFTQVARAVRAGGAVLGDLEPQQVLAVGESQSAFALTSYYDGVQPITQAFDGFLIHSRGSAPLPLVGPGEAADIAGSIGKPTAIFRTDLDTPVLDVQSESDVAGILSSYQARQPDSDHFRLWEVTGTAHADAHLLGPTADTLDCGVPINNGPLHVVVKAALRSLDRWVRTGEAPPQAEPLQLTKDAPVAVVRDPDGIALGGVRTSPVDVPVDVLSGKAGPNPAVICLLLGSTVPLPAERLAELYPSSADYVQRYAAATDAAIAAGFVLEEDRDALQAFAQPSRVAG